MRNISAIQSSTSKPPPCSTTHVNAGTAFFASTSSWLLILTILVLVAVIGIALYLFRTGRLRFVSNLSSGYSANEAAFSSPAGSSQSSHVLADERSRPPVNPARIDPSAETRASLQNRPWLKLVKECIKIYDELDNLSLRWDTSRQEVAHYVMSHLQESLERCGVELIIDDQFFDLRRHQLLAQTPGTTVLPHTRILEIVSPGFAIEQLVLRPAKVRVAN
jgi:hypothetical protein